MLKEFRFYWADAWGNTEEGIDTVLEVKPNNYYEIKMLVNGEPVSLQIDSEKLINDLESLNIYKWNNYSYRQDIEDGDMWLFSIKYDDTEIYAEGYNGYPPRFLEFLDVLHRHGFPRINMEGIVTTKDIGRSRKKISHNSSFSTYADYTLYKGFILGDDRGF